MIGTEITNISSSYVVVDDIIYPFKSTIEAFDFCFKFFHVLHASYPRQSERLWTVIQVSLYKFKTEWDKDSASDIINDLENKRKYSEISEESQSISRKKQKKIKNNFSQ